MSEQEVVTLRSKAYATPIRTQQFKGSSSFRSDLCFHLQVSHIAKLGSSFHFLADLILLFRAILLELSWES